MLRRFLCAVVLAFSLSVGVAQAAGPKDYAKGSGSVVSGTERFWFTAWSDPAGNDPQGTMKLESGGTTIYAVVTCLAVGGTSATIWGDITKQVGPPVAGDGLLFAVADFGPGNPDFFGAIIMPESVRAGQCAPQTIFNRVEGEITVIDE